MEIRKHKDWVKEKLVHEIVDYNYDHGGHRYQNEEILIKDMLKRLGLNREDLVDIIPSELEAKIRDNKLNEIGI